MAENAIHDQLDAAVQAMLAGANASPDAAAGEVGPLARVAAELRGLPGTGFRLRLKSDLERKAKMSTAAVNPVREGFHTVTPYLAGTKAAEVLDFIKRAFGAVELLRTTGTQGGMHAEARIDDSILMLGGYTSDMPAALHYLVPDADATYRRAMEAGAESLYAPEDKHYGAREAGVRDPGGNVWYISTPKPSAGPVPEGFRAITPYLLPRGAAKLIDFLKQAWNAEEIFRAQSPDGRVMHASVRIGDSIVSMGDPAPPWEPMAMLFYLYVEDCDAWYRRALAADAASIQEPRDEFYGDRVAAVNDPLGNKWYIATHVKGVQM